MVVRGEGACRENLASSCSARTHRMGDGRVSSPLLSSCLSVLSSVLSFLLPPGHLNLHYAPWPGSSSAFGSGSVIQVQLVYPLMETGDREASGWAGRRARKKWRKAAFLAPPQQGACKLTNFAARNLVFPLIFKIPPSTVLTYYRPNFYIKKKRQVCTTPPKTLGTAFKHFLFVPTLSSRQRFSTRGSSAPWRHMEIRGAFSVSSLLRNLVGQGQGCWTTCIEQDRPAQWGTVWPKVLRVPSLKMLWDLRSWGQGFSCSQVCPPNLTKGLAHNGSSMNACWVKECRHESSILWHQLTELKHLLQAHLENQGAETD